MAKDNRWLVFACGAAGIVGGCLSSVLFHSLTANAQPSSATSSVIRVKRLDIVDDTGVVRAWIGMEPGNAGNAPTLTIGRPDQQHVVLADDGMTLLGPEGSGHAIRAQLSQIRSAVGPSGTARWGLAVYDSSGNAKYSWVTP
jgi:hypothetical protein